MEVNRPSRGKDVKAPVILTYSPYAALGGAREATSSPWLRRPSRNSSARQPRGLLRLRRTASGNPATTSSGACQAEVATGKIAMTAGLRRHDGDRPATEVPPHLVTIVPEAAISRWYEYAYSGGIRYAFNNEKLGNEGPTNGLVIDEQGFDTPVGFDFGFAMPPPTDVQDPTWAEKMQSTITPCDEVDHVSNGYNMDTPNYDKFWLERDYVKDAPKIKIPVLIGANWGDWNVKQEE